jgi:hypothetical protein
MLSNAAARRDKVASTLLSVDSSGITGKLGKLMLSQERRLPIRDFAAHT